MELLTEKQRARKARNMEVAAAYKEMRRRYPEASQSRIIDELARREVAGLTSISGIRKALIERGAIQARP